MNKYVALVLHLHEWLEFQQMFPEAGRYLHKKIATGATEVDNLVKELTTQPPEESGRHGWLFERKQRGQVAVLGAVLIMLFVLLAAVLIDAYALLEARNWGYRAAQQAALSGISNGRDWASLDPPPCAGGPPPMRLASGAAQNAAINLLQQEMTLRGISNYTHDVRVLPDYGGGSIAGYPPLPTRLGAGRGNWTSNEPAVGVYLSFPVSTFLMSFIGRPTVQISVFASAGVDQPDGACTP
ncbi:MAG: hypothetical protein KJ606_02760 [Chloroflexi bacterium]|nr:hypothetical protein [Chloroflexota bacterium]